MFTVGLAARLRGTAVTANAVHPGILRMHILLQAPGAFRVLSYLALPFAISPEEGAKMSVYLATSLDVKGASGQYFTKRKWLDTKGKSDAEKNRVLLWDLSLKSIHDGQATADRGIGCA